MDLISVIVPVFKVEQYLDQCVESIVNQTYKNLEIILVDDGSPDNCPAMCDEWAKRDSRIKVIHKKNGGGGDARNVALDIAQGEFIGMVDSDDYISPYMYEHLHSLINNGIDIVECEIITTNDDETNFDTLALENYTTEIYSTIDAMRFHIQDALFRQTPPNKLYRKSILNGVRFPVGTYIDDEFWTYKAVANANTLCHSNLKLYAYRQQNSSLMHAKFSIKRLNAIQAKCERLSLVKERFPELQFDAIYNLYYTCRYLLQMSLKELPNDEREEAIKYITKTFNVFIKSELTCSRLPYKEKIWLYLSRHSLLQTCKIRNFLKLGT